VPVEVIPTGSIALDVALGLGGLPRGRIVEIYGPESSGKCLTADTYVWSDRGLETIAEIFERAGMKASCMSRVTDVSESGIRLANEKGELETVVALTHNNRKPVLRLKLRSGRTISLTHNHPLRIVSDRGFIVWRKAGEIQVGDAVVSAEFGAVEAAEGDGLSEDEAVLLGYLVAEGTLCYDYSIRFTNWDPEVSGEFTRLMEHIAGVPVRNYGNKEFAVPGKEIRERFSREYGLDYVKAAGKKVPACVRVSGHKAQRAFLSALFEGDGWIDPTSTVGLGTASEDRARQVQLMLYGLGIPATVSSKYNLKYERDYWSVTVNPAVAHRFLSEVGFRSARRKAQVEKCFRVSPRDPQFENIPNLSGLLRDLRDDCGGDRGFDKVARDMFRKDMSLSCSRQRLAKIVEWCDSHEGRFSAGAKTIVDYLRVLSGLPYTYEEVVAVEDGGLQPTFDVVLPRTHSFLANGMLSHNTTVALHALANAQKAGGIAAFIDAEHALDPDYAKSLGVDTDALLVSQPDTGEQALEIMDMLIRSGAIDIVVVDSVAALVPKAEIEGEMGDSHVGLQARLMSQALRKITGALSQTKTTAIFINQLREKVGVMFGCMAYATRVTLADGTQEKIGKIVNQRMDVEVLSYDPETDQMVPRRIVNWFNNGKTDEFLQFSVAKSGGNGLAQFAATENHLVRTPGGWRQAGELILGDRVLVVGQQCLSEQQLQLILGSLMGDGNLSPNRRGRSGTRFRMGHGAKQTAYLDWKASLLGNIPHSRRINAKGAVFADFTPLPELAELHEAVYFGDGKKYLSSDYLKSLTPLALAIWYMDDGGFTVRSKGVQARTAGGTGRIDICVEAMSPGSRERLASYLRDTYGLQVKLQCRGAREVSVLQFSTSSSEKFQQLIAPYIHPSMEYKLLPRFRGQFNVEPEFAPATPRLVPARILDIHVKPPTRSMNRFDIEVEGSHNYFVDGVMVHNSPETTTGGKALKFYASIRLDIRRIETLKDGTEAVGNRTKVKVVKNKMSPPFKVAEFDILYGFGISREGSLIDLGVEQGIVRKSGAWYTYDGDQLGQGKENARTFLRDNPDVAQEIEKRIKEKLGIGPRLDADATVPSVPPAPAAHAANGSNGANGANGPGPTRPAAPVPVSRSAQ
jgi:recombination protein RecA